MSDNQIITSPQAIRMQQMVTSGFYDRSRLGLWIFEAIGREYDDIAAWARELQYEAFVLSCTWSIEYWEFIYGFEPDTSLTLDYRRKRLLAKKKSRPPINPARIEDVLSALIGLPVDISDPIKPYTFRVTVHETLSVFYDYWATLVVLRAIKPSHLALDWQSLVTDESENIDYSAGAFGEWVREYVIADNAPILTTTENYAAGALVEWTREYVIADNALILTTIADYTAGALSEWTREYVVAESTPILTATADYVAGAICEWIHEYITVDYAPIFTTTADCYADA